MEKQESIATSYYDMQFKHKEANSWNSFGWGLLMDLDHNPKRMLAKTNLFKSANKDKDFRLVKISVTNEGKNLCTEIKDIMEVT